MSAMKKKICMLGGFAVGKTSLVRRFVKSIFSEKYLTTVGVKIDKKEVIVSGREMDLILWDIYGEDEFQSVQTSHLRGASGYFLVVDITRRVTLDTAFMLQKRAEETIGKVPFVLVFNKSDLEDECQIDSTIIRELSGSDLLVAQTSAKTGHGVEQAFMTLAGKMMEG